MLETCFYDHECMFSKPLNIPGIYGIFCIPAKKWYIGQSLRVGTRVRNHKAELRDGVHENVHMNRAAKKYGIDQFIFFILETCDQSLLNERETFYIEFYNSLDKHCGYNRILIGYDHAASFSEASKKTRRAAFDNRKGSNKHLVDYIRSTYPKRSLVDMGREFGLDEEAIGKIVRNITYPDPNYIPPKIKHWDYNIQQAFEKIKPYLDSGKSLDEIRKMFNIPAKLARKATKHIKNIRDLKQTALVLNTETGVYYNGISEAAKSTGYLKKSTLQAWLTRTHELNKSPFILVEKPEKSIIKDVTILDESTGIFYTSFVEAAKVIGIRDTTMRQWLLTKTHRNKTSLKLV